MIAVFLAANFASAAGCMVPPDEEPEPPPAHQISSTTDDRPDIEQMQGSVTIDQSGHMSVQQFELDAQAQLKKVAADKTNFNKVLSVALGTYNTTTAESYRQKIVAGDFSWVPPVQLTSPAVLLNHEGAFSAANNRIYLNDHILGRPMQALVYFEEVGHFLDTKLRTSDATGDEGAIFRHLVVGTKLDDLALAALRRTNDHGSIVVGGKTLAVEFFGPDWLNDAWDGLVGVAKGAVQGIWDGTTYVWNGAVDAAGAIATAATATWDGAKTLGGWIGEGVEVAAGKYVELCQRSLYVVLDEVHETIELLHDAALDSYEGFKVLGKAAIELGNGNFKDAATLFYVGLAKLTVELTLDALTTAIVHTLSDLQMLLFLEPTPRSLTDEEKGILSVVHADSPVWFNAIQVKDGFSGLFSVVAEPFTNQTMIFMKKYGTEKTHEKYLQTIVHEVTHVWQFIHGGGAYRLNSIVYRISRGQDQYNWETDAPGKPWDQLLAEQQAQLIEDAYIASGMRPVLLMLDGRLIGMMMPLFLGPRTRADYTGYLSVSLAAFRHGDGASKFE